MYHDPTNPHVRVREEYKQFLTDFLAAIPGQFTIEDLIAEGDKVVVRYTFRGTHQGQWRGVSPSGKAVTFTGTQTYRFAEGKVAEIWANNDVFSLVQQLGLIPSMG
jgi:predicted ester cyclase